MWSNNEWSVETNKASISSSNEMDELESKLGIPLPEMVFGQNIVKIEHKPSKTVLSFTTFNALDGVDKTLGGKTKILQVANSEEWKAGKLKHKKEHGVPEGQLDYDPTYIHNPFDWTYTTSYEGDINVDLDVQKPTEIPYELLKNRDPILFFDEVPLYEDELGDFGLATYSVKLRVMPKCIFLLARFYMRVDNVAFRIRDTRVFVDMTTNEIIKEHVEKEGTFDEVKSKVPIWQEDYTALFRDPNWVDKALTANLKQVSSIKI